MKFGTIPAFLKWFVVSVAILILMAVTGLLILNRELSSYIERQLNAHVDGYRFSVTQATLSPTLALEIRGLTMIQTAHPDPPVAEIPRWHFRIQWTQIFSGIVVSDYLISHPTLRITLPQAKNEFNEDVPIHQKGWREAVYSFYPIKINEFKIEDADITYVDQDASKPLHLTHLYLRAGNIRNIQFPNDAYPSDLALEGHIFGSGRIQMNGHANFLAEPYAGINADLTLQHVPLAPLLPVTGRYNVQVLGGVVSTDGHLEYTAEGETRASVKTLIVEDAHVDYVHKPETAVQETRRARATVKAAHNLQDKPETRIRIDQGDIRNSEFGFVNEAATPPYRVFISHGELHLENISNRFTEGTGLLKMVGAFMGTGNTVIEGKFRPETKSPDFDLNLKIERTQMRAMNTLLRAYGNFDVTAGLFSVFSELSVTHGRVEGYVKPLFKDMKVYDARQDKHKGVWHQLYEGVIGGLAKLLENDVRDEVATKTEIEGPLQTPRTSTWQALVNVVRNAFFQAILPGFEHQIRHQG